MDISRENTVQTACETYNLNNHPPTLAQRNTNNVIAIGQLYMASSAARAKWCGKKVIVTKNGVQVKAPDGGDFFVWDGCQACSEQSNSILDFSLTALQKVDSNACTVGIVPNIQYQITSVQVLPFVA